MHPHSSTCASGGHSHSTQSCSRVNSGHSNTQSSTCMSSGHSHIPAPLAWAVCTHTHTQSSTKLTPEAPFVLTCPNRTVCTPTCTNGTVDTHLHTYHSHGTAPSSPHPGQATKLERLGSTELKYWSFGFAKLLQCGLFRAMPLFKTLHSLHCHWPFWSISLLSIINHYFMVTDCAQKGTAFLISTAYISKDTDA